MGVTLDELRAAFHWKPRSQPTIPSFTDEQLATTFITTIIESDWRGMFVSVDAGATCTTVDNLTNEYSVNMSDDLMAAISTYLQWEEHQYYADTFDESGGFGQLEGLRLVRLNGKWSIQPQPGWMPRYDAQKVEAVTETARKLLTDELHRFQRWELFKVEEENGLVTG